MVNRLLVFLTSFFIWVLMNWRYGVEYVWVGLAASCAVTLVVGDFFNGAPVFLKDPRRIIKFVFIYVPLFIVSMLMAAFSIAYRIIHPRLPIRPGLVKVKTELKSDIALMILANAVTLTSGTLTVDVDKERGFLYVHWIDVQSEDEVKLTKAIVGKFEPLIKSIFE